jgi:hypothetical protein
MYVCLSRMGTLDGESALRTWQKDKYCGQDKMQLGLVFCRLGLVRRVNSSIRNASVLNTCS